MYESFEELNQNFREFIKTQDLQVKHSGATALVVLFIQEVGILFIFIIIINQKLYVANLGDTRSVLCRGGKAVRVSRDHKPMDEEDRINALGGYVIGR